MTVVLLLAITTYGNLVLTGVVEEKSSRVVEVLLARVPARNLLAGKVAGIGLLGLAQVGLTALVALAAVTAVDSVDVPAVRGAVLAWVVVWFVLGYALYATVYGALGSLASRTEDAQSVAGPVTVVLLAAYFTSLAAIGQPDSGLGQAGLVLPGDRAACHAQPRRHGRDRLVGAGARGCPHPRRHRRPRAVRRPGVRRRDPPHRADAQVARRLARHERNRIEPGRPRPAFDGHVAADLNSRQRSRCSARLQCLTRSGASLGGGAVGGAGGGGGAGGAGLTGCSPALPGSEPPLSNRSGGYSSRMSATYASTR